MLETVTRVISFEWQGGDKSSSNGLMGSAAILRRFSIRRSSGNEIRIKGGRVKAAFLTFNQRHYR
jgi:hypothetical protein